MKLLPILFTLILCLSTMTLHAQDTPTPEPIPEPMPLIDEGDYDVINFLLLGSDTSNPQNAGRTDVMLVFSVNRTAGTVALLSIPRDLYVYIPGLQMSRINAAYGFGEHNGTEAGGPGLLIETIRYNLGLEIDYYARVDFNGFRNIVNSVGSVEVSVDCAIQDWRLREPELDPTLEDNWEMFTLPVGLHRMDGDLALWYVRSRRTSSDFDRGRRQQDMMRALWWRIRDLGLLEQLQDVWPQVAETVETDITLGDMLGLVPTALTIDTSRIRAYTFRPNAEVTFGLSPERSHVLFPVPNAITTLEQQMMVPPTEFQLTQEHPTIEVVNASGMQDMARVAADRLAWEGFVAQIAEQPEPYRRYTAIYDYTGRRKGSSLGALQSVLRVSDDGVVFEPDPNRTVDFRIVLGGSYYACTHSVLPPTPEPEVEATAEP